MCEHNAKVALEDGSSGIALSWQLAALAARTRGTELVQHLGSSEESMGWRDHPLCCQLLLAL